MRFATLVSISFYPASQPQRITYSPCCVGWLLVSCTYSACIDRAHSYLQHTFTLQPTQLVQPAVATNPTRATFRAGNSGDESATQEAAISWSTCTYVYHSMVLAS
jgi:hypothetical protein